MASGLIDTPRAHICPVDQHCPCRLGWGSLKLMTGTQRAARAAAQLHEAVQDVARVAARRSAHVQWHMAELPMLQVHELTEDLGVNEPEALVACGRWKKSKSNETQMPSRASVSASWWLPRRKGSSEVNSSCSDLADRTRPGELLSLVANGLAESGFQVRPPERPGSCRLVIACRGARCTLAVDDWGDAEWAYCPGSGDGADAKELADVATALLTGRADDFPCVGRGYGHERITLKGVVGLELRARGLDVGLVVCRDEDFFDAHAEIVAASPGSDEGAKVFITDQGCLTWIRDYWDECGTAAFETDSSWGITDPAGVAAAVVETVTRAMSYLRPIFRCE
jgi:hypothetical protein